MIFNEFAGNFIFFSCRFWLVSFVCCAFGRVAYCSSLSSSWISMIIKIQRSKEFKTIAKIHPHRAIIEKTEKLFNLYASNKYLVHIGDSIEKNAMLELHNVRWRLHRQRSHKKQLKEREARIAVSRIQRREANESL